MSDITLVGSVYCPNNLSDIESRLIQAQQSTVASIVEQGALLKHAKDKIPHGQKDEWLAKMGYDKSTAAKFIKAFDKFGNVGTFPHLSQSKLFALLPDHVSEETVEKVISNPDMPVKQIKELTKADKADSNPEPDAIDAEYELVMEQDGIEPDSSVEVDPRDQRIAELEAEVVSLKLQLKEALKGPQKPAKEVPHTEGYDDITLLDKCSEEQIWKMLEVYRGELECCITIKRKDYWFRTEDVNRYTGKYLRGEFV